MMTLSVRAAFVLGCLCLASMTAQAQHPNVERGQAFAQTHCSRCHAIGASGESPLAKAPPFRTLHTRYAIEDLGESLAEGMKTGHPEIPELQLDTKQIEDLIGYLKSLEPCEVDPDRETAGAVF